MATLLVSVIVAVITGLLTAIVPRLMDRKWKQKDSLDETQKAIMRALKVLTVDRVRHLGKSYIERGSLTLEEREDINEMYEAYKALGGNGDLKTVMSVVDKLPITEDKKPS